MAKRSRAVIIATLIARNLRLRIGLRLRPNRPVDLGARNLGFSLEESTGYVDWVLDDYERHGLDGARLDDARILELGPGDTLGVALRLVARGAAQVVCLDKFVTARDPAQQRAIHSALRDAMPAAEAERLSGVLAPDGELMPGQEAVVLIEGTGVEEADTVATGPFDAIISRAVLAHLWRLSPGFEAMDRLLAPGGTTLHKVDLSDHGLFSDAGHNPLAFLTVGDRTWNLMRSHTGLTNRARIGEYRALLDGLGYDSELEATATVEVPVVEEIRPRLLPRFRDLPEAELATTGAFIAARKPA